MCLDKLDNRPLSLSKGSNQHRTSQSATHFAADCVPPWVASITVDRTDDTKLFMLKNRFLIIIIAVYFVFAIGYSVIIPLGEAPDEVSHFAYVQFLAMQHQLPGKAGAASGQAHQAPLYYVVSALLISWIPDQAFNYIANPDWELDNLATPNLLLHPRAEAFPYQKGTLAWHIVRFFSVCLGALTLLCSYWLARTIFPNHEVIARLTIAFMAFLPSFDFLASTVNNDNLVVLLSVATLLFFLRVWKVDSLSKNASLGILLGLALLAKLTAWGLWLTLALGILIGFQQSTLWQRLRSLLLVYGTALLIYAPWLLYNTLVYQDPFGWSRLMDSTPRLTPLTWHDWQIYAEHMFESFWGKLGGAGHIEIAHSLYFLLSLLVIGGGIGWILRYKAQRSSSKAVVSAPRGRIPLILSVVFAILLLASHLRLYTVLLGADQARQVFSALPVVALLVGAGLFTWLKTARLSWLFSGVMAYISASVLLFAITLYHPAISTANIAPSIVPPAGDFAQQIRLLDYQVQPTQPLPGDTIYVTAHWQALANLHKNYWLLLKVDQQGKTVASRDSVPSAGLRTTDWWHKGELFTSTHKLQLPPDLAAGSYELLLGMHPLGNWDWVKINQQDVLKLADLQVK